MGATGSGRRDQDGSRSLSTRAARVVPNVPTFAVDDGFWYSIPDHLAEDVEVGSIVRVPLSGRRVRGWVIELSEEREGKLKDIAGVSGAVPVFDGDLSKTLLWAATHYVAPVSVMLAKATPPNLPRRTGGDGVTVEFPEVTGRHPLGEIATSVASGRKRPAQALVARWQRLDWLPSLVPVLARGQSALVVSASAAEVDRIASRARPVFGDALIAVSAETDAEITADWERAQTPGRLVVGTPRVATWLIAMFSLAVVLEEGRRAMKERQTPTLHVREVLRTRSLLEGISTVFFGPTPSVEVLSSGAEVRKVGNRAWPLVEVVDRNEDAPGSGLLSERVIVALRATAKAGRHVFVLSSHRMTEPMITEINSRLGAKVAGAPDRSHAIWVGTERDLAGLEPVALTVASNVDAMLMVPGYRSSEEALRVLARLANSLQEGSGHRMMVQTDEPDSPLIEALRRGEPIPYLEAVLVDRARTGVPPAAEMIAVEIRGQQPEKADEELVDLPDAEVLGPIEIEGGRRWLLEGDLRKARLELRRLVGRWRDTGATVRIDADPIDI